MESKKIGVRTEYAAIITFILLIISCKNNIGNIEVSDFTKYFILSYLNDDINSTLTPRSHIIKVTISDTGEGYNLVVNEYAKSLLSTIDTSYFGYCKLNGYDTYFYGKQHKEFAVKCKGINKKMVYNQFNNEKNVEYDPIEFSISLFKNFKFDEMHSFKVNVNEDIDVLKGLADMYLKTDNNISINDFSNEVFCEVQQPALFEPGIDSLLSFIYSNIELPKPIEPEGLNEKIFIRVIITSLGEVKNPMIIRSSGSDLLDSAVVNVVRKFPSFLPAKHRGKIVNSYSSISVLVRPLLGH